MAEMFTRRQRSVYGITLVEMMIVVAIVAVLAALAAPDMRAFFINNRLLTANNEFMTALNTARSEAIRRGLPVTVRRVSAAQDCSAASQDWTCGWEIFVDLNDDGVCNNCNTTPSGENTIRVAQPLARPLTLFSSRTVTRIFPSGSGRSPLAGGIAEFIPFTPDGRVPLPIDSPDDTNALWVLCYEGALRQGTQSRSRAVLLNGSGRARQAVDSNNDGRPEDEFVREIDSCTNPR